MRPLDCVNDRGFVELLTTLEPRFNLESRTHITQTLIPQMYNDLRLKVQDNLLNAKFVSLTTDAWSGRNTKSFNTVTSQYINNDWELKNNILTTTEMIESHTAENLAAEFEEVLADWKLKKDFITVTTDNAANISLAMKKCAVIHLRCMAHTLNLSTQKALQISTASRICGKMRRVVSHFHRSTIAANLLRKATSQLELPNLKLIMDVSTRWNSTLDMLDQYIVLRPAICVVLANPAVRNLSDTLTEEELNIVEQLIKVHKHKYYVTFQ